MSTKWMITASGRSLHFGDESGDQVTIEDVAHATSNMCRYGGHTKEFYSVAQHMVHCAEEALDRRPLPPIYTTHAQFALDMLLHDAPEAYTGDVVTPLKRYIDQLAPGYIKVLNRIDRTVMKELSTILAVPALPHTLNEYMRDIDVGAAIAEAEWSWGEGVTKLWHLPSVSKMSVPISEPWAPQQAKKEWLRMLKLLVGTGTYIRAMEHGR